MAALGFAEIVLLLLMGGFLPSDVDPLPPDQILRGMPAECEVVAFQDLRGAYEALDAGLTELSSQPWLMGQRDIAEGLGELSAMLRRAPAEATAQLGFNPFTDVTAVGLCGRLGTAASGEPVPSFLLVVQGDFDATIAARLAGQMGLPPVTLANGASAFGEREGGVVFGMVSPSPGLLFLGSEDLLGPRAAGAVAGEWEATTSESLVGRLRELAPGGPRTMLGFQPSAGLRFLMSGEAPVFMAQQVAGLDRAIWLSDGRMSYFETRATGPDAYRDHELILGGLGEYAQASPHALRAVVQVVLGLLSPDDPELEEPLRYFVSHREEILTFLNDSGLLSEAEVIFASDPASLVNTLTMTRTGGGLESVTGLLLLGGAMSYMVLERSGGYEPYPPPSHEYLPAPTPETAPVVPPAGP